MRKIWIIRFSDGTIGSCYGTRSGAAEIAELRKEDYGGSYTIEGGRNAGERTEHFFDHGDYCRKSPDMAMGYQNRMRDRDFYDRGNCMRNNPVAGG